MNFYTNVLQRGNNLHVRAVVNGERQNFKIRYQPTLFSPFSQETGYKTLEGKSVRPKNFATMKEAKDWVDLYESHSDQVYGNTQFS